LKQRITNIEMRREAAHTRRTAVMRTRSNDREIGDMGR
jgi:hypothetical protein